MKDEFPPTAISISIPPSATATAATPKKDGPVTALFGKGGYKFWVLAALLLLAFWSMVTGSVSLKWSTGDLTRISDNADFPVQGDLDILEVEEQEKVVRKMWDVYTQSANARLTRFWQEAFEAAYEYLSSDVPGVRDAAISEIAQLSMGTLNLDPLSLQSTSTREGRGNSKQYSGSKE